MQPMVLNKREWNFKECTVPCSCAVTDETMASINTSLLIVCDPHAAIPPHLPLVWFPLLTFNKIYSVISGEKQTCISQIVLVLRRVVFPHAFPLRSIPQFWLFYSPAMVQSSVTAQHVSCVGHRESVLDIPKYCSQVKWFAMHDCITKTCLTKALRHSHSELSLRFQRRFTAGKRWCTKAAQREPVLKRIKM